MLPIQRLDHLTLTNDLVNALAHENTFIGFNSSERAWIYYTNLGGENALVSGTSHADIARLYSIDQKDILQKGDTYYEINNLTDSIVIRDYARDLFDENNYIKLVKQIRMFHPKKEIRVRLINQGIREDAYYLIQDHDQ